MSNSPLTLPNTFANQSGTIQLALLDQNFTPLANALNALSSFSNYFLDTSGAANAITVTVAAPLTFGYTAGIQLQVKVANTNTSGTVVINVNALGNQNVKNPDGSNPGVGALVLGGVYTFQYDGTNFQLVGGAAGGFSGFANPSGTIGLTAVNGSATTAMRSDGAPVLSQAIVPTWTGVHTFTPASGTAVTVNAVNSSFGALIVGGATSGQSLGLLIRAGTTSADQALLVNNKANTATYLQVNGDGSTKLGWNGTTQAVTTSAAGNVTFAAPSSGNTATFNGVAGGSPIAVSAGAVGAPSLTFTTAGNTGIWSSAAANLDISTASTNRINVNSTGNVTVNTPGAGVAVTANGASGQYGIQVVGINSAGNSRGLQVVAGTNSSDVALIVANAASSANYFEVRGDGVVSGNDGTNLFELGYKDTPLNSQSSNYVPVVSDRGKTINATASISVTINTGVFSGGAVLAVSVGNGATVSIVQGAGMTLQWAGNGATTGTRTLTGAGLATIVFLTGSAALISGAGLS